MTKLSIKKVFINPKNNYELVDETLPEFKKDNEGNGFILVSPNTIIRLITTFMVDDPKAEKPVWFKKLKSLGINIESDATELEVELIDEDEYSFRQYDGTWTKVTIDKVMKDGKTSFALIDGVIKHLNKRSIKSCSIAGINVGNEYSFNKLLGLKQASKK